MGLYLSIWFLAFTLPAIVSIFERSLRFLNTNITNRQPRINSWPPVEYMSDAFCWVIVVVLLFPVVSKIMCKKIFSFNAPLFLDVWGEL